MVSKNEILGLYFYVLCCDESLQILSSGQIVVNDVYGDKWAWDEESRDYLQFIEIRNMRYE